MDRPILTTKIRVPPPQPRILRRDRLAHTYRRGPIPRLTLVSAPAGFGKTTCAREIADAFPGRVTWFAIDPEDGEPSRFYTYFLASLREAVPELSGRSLQALDSSNAPSIPSVLTMLVNELSELNEPVCGVLDDLHLVSNEAIYENLEFLLTHGAPRFHLVIVTRADPPFNLARLRANGDVLEIRSPDLRFTTAEISSFFTNRFGEALDPQHITLLEQRTEGWIAGIQMAAISMSRHDDPELFLRTFGGTHRHVLDYLTNEVLSTQPEAVQRFLIRSSILSRLTGDLCDALTPVPELPGKETLEYLEETNLFVAAVDEERRWFRLHPLFAELLRARLAGDLRQLHERAGEWLCRNDLHLDALSHAGKSGNPTLIRISIDGAGRPLYARGEAASVLTTLEGLSEATRDGDAMLWIHQAWATWTAYRSDEVPSLLERAESADSRDQRVEAHLHTLRANLAANEYDIEAISTHSSKALDLLDTAEPYPRAGAYRARAVAHDAADQREDAIQAYQRAIELSRTSGFTHLWIVAETGLGIVYERDFALNSAEHSYREVLRLAGDPEQPVTCEAHAGLGRIAYGRNDLQTAERRLIRGRDLARTIQGIDSHIASDIYLCRVYAAAGDRKRAEREMARIKREIRRGNFERQMAYLSSLKLRLALLDRDMEKAEALFSASEEGEGGADDFDRLRLQIARGESRAALKELRSIEERGESMGWNDRIITARILRAVATDSAGDRDVARGLLKSAWELLEPEAAVRPVLEEGEIARALLREIVDPTSQGSPSLAGKDRAPTGNVTLSRREREVLTLVSEGLSNEEIGARLFVTLSTVKGHNSRIFEKLGVRRRTEAVAEAKRLGIL